MNMPGLIRLAQLEAGVALVVTGFILGASGVCPPNWVEHGSACYFFTYSVKTWEDASTYCGEQHGMMLVIESPEENTFITQELTQRGMQFAWLGCSDITIEDTWVCEVDGVFSPLQYGNWALNQRHSGDNNEDCAAIKNDGTWYDVVCTSTSFRTICKSTSTAVDVETTPASTWDLSLSCYILGADGRP